MAASRSSLIVLMRARLKVSSPSRTMAKIMQKIILFSMRPLYQLDETVHVYECVTCGWFRVAEFA